MTDLVRPEREERFYVKRGGRYRQVDLTYSGFPADGIWHCEIIGAGSSQTRIARLGELPPAAVWTRAALQPHFDTAVKAAREAIDADCREQFDRQAGVPGQIVLGLKPHAQRVVNAVFQALAIAAPTDTDAP